MTINEAIKKIEDTFPYWAKYYKDRTSNKAEQIKINSWEDIYNKFNINPNDTIMEIHPNHKVFDGQDVLVVIGTPLNVWTYREEEANGKTVRVEKTISRDVTYKSDTYIVIYTIG